MGDWPNLGLGPFFGLTVIASAWLKSSVSDSEGASYHLLSGCQHGVSLCIDSSYNSASHLVVTLNIQPSILLAITGHLILDKC